MENIHKSFEVIIGKNSYDVWNIESKTHESLNGEPSTWWLYFAPRAPEGTPPPLDSDNWLPYHVSINRMLWDIQFKQFNTTKGKWGNTQFRNHTTVEMRCNNKLIYSFTTTGDSNGLSFAMGKVQYLQVALAEHPYDFFHPEKEKGRKIYWYGLPATIEPRRDGWEIIVRPDYDAGLSKEEWWKELRRRESKIGGEKDTDWDDIEKEDNEDEERLEYINWGDAFSDGHIDWFRKTAEKVQ